MLSFLDLDQSFQGIFLLVCQINSIKQEEQTMHDEGPGKIESGEQIIDKIQMLKSRLGELEILIQDTKARLPAHSAKPPVMMDLLEYEDEYDDLVKKLDELKKK